MIDPLIIGGTLLVGLVVLLALGAPIATAIALPSVICMVLIMGTDTSAVTSAQRMFQGANSFALLAIPLFILAGVVMNSGGIAARLINLARLMVGKAPAPLIQTNVMANTIFGAVSGSAVAAAAAVGTTMTPMQRKEGYDRSFSAAANVASAPAGMLIPPSNTLIVFSLVSGTSVGALFMAGYAPGILWALGCMAVVFVYARRHPELRGESFPGLASAIRTVLQAIPSLGLIVVAIGGIVAGFFTPTEGAAIAVVYALLLSFAYRTISLRDLPRILFDACRTSSVVVFLIAVASIMSHVMTYARIPQLLAEHLFGWTDSPTVVLLVMMLALLLIGVVLDPTPAILIFTPIFLPIALAHGIDPVHFGIMMVMNLSIGVISPPSAPVLFVGAQVAHAKVEKVIVKLTPFYVIVILILLLVAFVPAVSLGLPRLLGIM